MFKTKHLSSVHVPHHKNTAGIAFKAMPTPACVNISLSQNIGAPCKPVVAPGDKVYVGTKIGDSEAFVSAPVHASISGTVKKMTTQRNAAGTFETLVTIESDGLAEWDPALTVPVVNSYDDFVKAVHESGLVGMGGAAFPTWIKAKPTGAIKTLIVNAAECEPYITSDHRTIVDEGENLIDGIKAVTKWLNIPEACIAIEDNKKDAIARCRQMIREQNITNIRILEMQAVYPKGAERVLVYEVTGKECPAGVLPASLGVIVSNASTIAFIGQFLKDGRPFVTRYVTIDGDAITEPQNVKVPMGTSLKDIVDFCGGYRTPPAKIIMGGPMMGRAIYSDDMPISKNNNAVLFFSKEAAVLPEETACIRCGRCHKSCPFNLYPMLMADAYSKKDVRRLADLQIMQCMECGCCSYACPAHRPLSFTNKLGKALVKEAANDSKH